MRKTIKNDYLYKSTNDNKLICLESTRWMFSLSQFRRVEMLKLSENTYLQPETVFNIPSRWRRANVKEVLMFVRVISPRENFRETNLRIST